MIPYAAKHEIFNSVGYRPHEGQERGHRSVARTILAAGAERGGKSRFASAEGTCELVYPCRRVAICGQDYDETKAEIEYILSDLGRLDAIPRYGASTPKQGKWEISTRTKSYVETVSLRDGAGELTGRGKPYHLVILAEAGRIRDLMGAFLAAAGRVAETRGRIILAGTLWDDYGAYCDLYKAFEGPNIYGGELFRFPAWLNTKIYPKGPNGEENPEITRMRKILPANEFARRFAAKLVPSPARIYPEFTPEHIRIIEWDPEAPVDLTIDPGYFPSKYAILPIQPNVDDKGRECINVIDELWLNHHTHHQAIDTAMEQVWWPNVQRVYGGHETKQHPSAESTEEVWKEKTGLPFTIVDKMTQWTRINRVKTFLQDPSDESIRLFVDVKCQGLADEFRSWKRKTDAHGEVRSDLPEEMGSDALDALGNYLIEVFGPVAKDYTRRGRRGHLDIPARG